MVDMKWQNPPSRSSRGTQYDEIIEELKRNPGRWALVSETWKTSGPPSPFKKAGCEATCRANKDQKTWALYARYPATPTPAAPPVAAPVNVEKAKVREAIKSGTALTPPPAPAPKRQAPPAAAVTPANDFGMGAFRAARAARGVPAEGQR